MFTAAGIPIPHTEGALAERTRYELGETNANRGRNATSLQAAITIIGNLLSENLTPTGERKGGKYMYWVYGALGHLPFATFEELHPSRGQPANTITKQADLAALTYVSFFNVPYMETRSAPNGTHHTSPALEHPLEYGLHHVQVIVPKGANTKPLHIVRPPIDMYYWQHKSVHLAGLLYTLALLQDEFQPRQHTTTEISRRLPLTTFYKSHSIPHIVIGESRDSVTTQDTAKDPIRGTLLKQYPDLQCPLDIFLNKAVYAQSLRIRHILIGELGWPLYRDGYTADMWAVYQHVACCAALGGIYIAPPTRATDFTAYCDEVQQIKDHVVAVREQAYTTHGQKRH